MKKSRDEIAEELKRALRRLGEVVNPERILRGSPPLSQRVLEEVITATETLSRRSTGALIVIKQRADLSTFVRQGVRLNAEVSAELLYSIFISDRDNHLRSADFFDAEKHPTLSFVSTGVVDKGNGEFTMAGTLTIRGVAKPIELKGEFLGSAKDPWGNEKVAFTASA